MAVDPSAAVTGDVLDDRQHSALEQPFADRSAKTGDAVGLASIGPVTDHRIGARDRKIEHRQAANGDVQLRKIVGDQPCPEMGGGLGPRLRQ